MDVSAFNSCFAFTVNTQWGEIETNLQDGAVLFALRI